MLKVVERPSLYYFASSIIVLVGTLSSYLTEHSLIYSAGYFLAIIVMYATVVQVLKVTAKKQHEEDEEVLKTVINTFLTSPDIIDAELHSRARRFMDECGAQAMSQRDPDTTEEIASVLALRVQTAKKAFWDAAELGRILGFNKPDSVKQCLTLPIRYQYDED